MPSWNIWEIEWASVSHWAVGDGQQAELKSILVEDKSIMTTRLPCVRTQVACSLYAMQTHAELDTSRLELQSKWQASTISCYAEWGCDRRTTCVEL